MLPTLLILLAFAADRLSKWWIATNMDGLGVWKVHPLLTFRLAYNRGVAFGMWQGVGPIVGWLSILVVIGLLLYLSRVPRPMWLLRAGLAVLIGGALGNLVDRVFAGQVLDFIETPLRPGIFNVADVMIYSGVFLCLAGIVLQKGGDRGQGSGDGDRRIGEQRLSD